MDRAIAVLSDGVAAHPHAAVLLNISPDHLDRYPSVDEYYALLSAYHRQGWKDRLGNPVWHMHSGHPPAIDTSDLSIARYA